MKFKVLATAAAALLTAHSHAKEVRFEFTATIDWIAEYDSTTRENTFVSESSFAGAKVSKTDAVRGSFYFDSASPLGAYQPPTPASGTYRVYALPTGTWGMSYTVGTLKFTSGGPLPGHVQVANNASTLNGWDIFYLSASNDYNPNTLFQVGTLSLFDSSATVFSSDALPSTLDLKAFSYKSFFAGWLRHSDGNQMNVGTTIASLTAVSPVPEPSTTQMLIVGALCISCAAARRRAA